MKKRLLFCLLSIVAFVATGLTASAGEKPLLGSGKWYRLVTRCAKSGDSRIGLCIELLTEGHQRFTDYNNNPKGTAPAVGMIWSAVQSTDHNQYQYWRFEADPNGSGKYAMVCEAVPDGSLKPVPTVANNTGRWIYDNSAKHYDFTVKPGHNELATEINTIRIPLPSDPDGVNHMALAASGQSFSIMVYGSHDAAQTCDWKMVADPEIPVIANITYKWCDENGGLLAESATVEAAIGEAYTVAWPTRTINDAQYYSFVGYSHNDGEVVTPTEDMTLTAVYHTDAVNGVKAVAGVVSKVEAGKSYLIYDDNNSNGRNAFRYVNSANNQVIGLHATTLSNADPYFVWTLEAAENGFYIKNNGAGLGVQAVERSGDGYVGATPGIFTITDHSTAGYKSITGSNGISWDGEGGTNYRLVGWSAPGHPMQFMEYYAQPYFTVTVNTVRVDPMGNAEDEVVASAKYMVKAGEAFELPAYEPKIAGEGYADNEYMNTTGDDAYLDNVNRNMVVNNNYNVRTGVEGIAAEGKAKVVYDLMGRKLNDATTPGIYVINGKKVVVK